jgi:excisionase family DNA binding protein
MDAATENSILNTALLHMAQEGDVQSMNDLLAQQANVNARTGDGWTPLMFAIINGHTAAAQLLLKRNADIDARNNKGWTALRFAISMGDIEGVQLLLSAGADINATDQEGNTALMQAARENTTECVRLLVKNGADVNMSNERGETAFTLAAQFNHTSIIEILRHAGAHDRPPEDQKRFDDIFTETTLNRLREEFSETVEPVEQAPIQERTQAVVPAQPTQTAQPTPPIDSIERLVAALEALRSSGVSSSGAPAARQSISVADISHKLLLTLPEAAALSNLSRGFLLKAIREGKLKAQKIGRGWRIKNSDLEIYVRDLF